MMMMMMMIIMIMMMMIGGVRIRCIVWIWTGTICIRNRLKRWSDHFVLLVLVIAIIIKHLIGVHVTLIIGWNHCWLFEINFLMVVVVVVMMMMMLLLLFRKDHDLGRRQNKSGSGGGCSCGWFLVIAWNSHVFIANRAGLNRGSAIVAKVATAWSRAVIFLIFCRCVVGVVCTGSVSCVGTIREVGIQCERFLDSAWIWIGLVVEWTTRIEWGGVRRRGGSGRGRVDPACDHDRRFRSIRFATDHCCCWLAHFCFLLVWGLKFSWYCFCFFFILII